MGINKKKNIDLNFVLNRSNLQNNQKKDYVRNLNNNVPKKLNFKRKMYTKCGNMVKSKSSEIINKPWKSDIIFNSPINSKKTGLDTWITTPILKNRNYAFYNKLGKDTYVVNNDIVNNDVDDTIKTLNHNEQIKIKTNESDDLLKWGEITDEQHLVSIKRLGAFDLSFVHTVVLDIISQNDINVKFMYHVITTQDKIVDYGGANKYKPIFLCKDEVKNKNFYTIPLTYLRTLTREEFVNLFKYKKKSEFKDSLELQKKITESLIKIEKEHGNFRQLDINKECLNIDIRKINTNEMFPPKEPYYRLTEWEEHIYK